MMMRRMMMILVDYLTADVTNLIDNLHPVRMKIDVTEMMTRMNNFGMILMKMMKMMKKKKMMMMMMSNGDCY